MAELDLGFMFEPPRVRRNAAWEEPDYEEPSFQEPADLTDDVFSLLSSPNITSKESVVRTYDHEVKGNTVLKPMHGRYGGPNDAAVIKPLSGSWKGLVISCGINPNYGRIDPYWMAASSIDEAIRNNTSVGGRRIALLDNFTWGNPERIDRLGSLVRACKACYDFAKGFQTPFISGKDSLYNESPLGPVTPTLLITAIGIIPDVRKTVSVDVKQPGNLIYVVGQTYQELGGSQYYQMKGFTGRAVPEVRMNRAKKTVNSIVKAIDSGYVKSCHDVSEGGVAIAAAEMVISGGYGMDLRLEDVPRSRRMNRNDCLLFSESNSRFLVEVPVRHREHFESLMKDNVYAAIGRVRKDNYLSFHGLNGEKTVGASITELRDCWKRGPGG